MEIKSLVIFWLLTFYINQNLFAMSTDIEETQEQEFSSTLYQIETNFPSPEQIENTESKLAPESVSEDTKQIENAIPGEPSTDVISENDDSTPVTVK